MRGQLLVALARDYQRRIIPARAGPTDQRRRRLELRTDHPRSCGANDDELRQAFVDDGSSPLVRGQRQRLFEPAPEVRIIPARAGPTVALEHRCEDNTDHPRSCGANFGLQWLGGKTCGSSPLVRGQLSPSSLSNHAFRIIPARAGPTCSGKSPRT